MKNNIYLNTMTTESSSTDNQVIEDVSVLPSNLSPSYSTVSLLFNYVPDIYMVWSGYAFICLLCLWVLIGCAWYYYRDVISNVAMETNVGLQHRTLSSSSVEGLEFPMLRSTSDVTWQDRNFMLSPETSKIDQATLRKKET